MKLRHLTTSLVATAAVAAPIAGCGNADASGSAQSPTMASSQSGRGAATVTIRDFKFTPGALTVKQGARIIMMNHDTTAHTATADNGDSFDTGNINSGSSATFTLSKVGTYSYHCSIHPFMHGTITVR